ncbi:MAG: hypothetical protein H7Y13_06165 [Sphingobacteriaceae bacterium]|nr:hypothetical protein [Sphingobacteriaceae bacterium]
MLNYSSPKSLLYFAFFLLIVSCSKSEGGDPEPAAATLASNLLYNPASLQLQAGTPGTSVKPSISGSTPVTFSVTTSPASNGAVTIDSEGKIKTSASLAAGTYNVSVIATNAAGAVTFTNIYAITVTAATPSAPQNLLYSPNSKTVTQGTALVSATPTITSLSTVNYSITSVPSSSAITINNQGVISGANTLAAGTYMVSVTASNTQGSTLFTNAYSITVNSAGTNAVTYTNDIQAIIQNNCGSCHISGSEVKFNSYTSTKNNIDGILTRIKLAQGASGMMPNGGTKLPQSTINTIQKWKDDGLLQ